MEQINIIEENPTIIRKIGAFVIQVDEKVMRLKSESLTRDDVIQMSAVVAFNSLPRRKPYVPNLLEEFVVDDKILLDVRQDSGRYIPFHIHAMQFIRPEGTRLVGDGLVVSLTEHVGVVVRSSYLPDFTFPKDRIFPASPEIVLRLGSSVLFEVIVTPDDQIKGLNMRVVAEDEKDVSFPVYRGMGTICLDRSAPYIQCQTLDGTAVQFPVYNGAFHGCGVPMMAMNGETVQCTMCPKDPRDGNSILEVIYFEPVESTVPLEERPRPQQLEGVRCLGGSPPTRTSFREVQCNRNYNEQNLQVLREAFLYVIEHADTAGFERMIHKYPKFTATMIEELGLDFDQPVQTVNPGGATSYQEFLRGLRALDLSTNEFQSAGGYQEEAGAAAQGGGPRLPTAPSFSPDDTFLSDQLDAEEETGELEAAAAALSFSSNSRPPQFRPEELFSDVVPVSNLNRGGNVIVRSPSTTESFSSDRRSVTSQDAAANSRARIVEHARPISNLGSTSSNIENVGRTRIDMPAPIDSQGGNRNRNVEPMQWPGRTSRGSGSVGKVKPG